ncbi:replicative DNA helicase [Kitasatospora sp. NPDC002227]|uniref:replicative DNA helicase n=1 Tax=Kitasatospora sp. NPDC002227 TaxID=3154773 RepID=UPI00332CFACC
MTVTPPQTVSEDELPWVPDENPEDLVPGRPGRGRSDNSQFERVPPQDVPAEQSTLGGMLLSKDAIGDVVGLGLKGPDFYRPAHETIYAAILDLYAAGEPADPITVAAELTKRGELARVGGASYLHTLVEKVPTAANAEYYAGIVQERAILRRLVSAGTDIAGMGYAAEGDVDEIVNAAQTKVFEVAVQQNGDTMRPAGFGLDLMADKVEALGQQGNPLTGVPTGLADLDNLTRGFQPGQLIVVAARPAIGKSTLALDFARACSIANGMTSVFFSLEMGREELQMRLVSAEGKIALHHLRSGHMTEDDWTRMGRVMPQISEAPLFLDDSPTLTAMEIRTKSRKLAQKSDLKLIIVDYLQLVEYGGKSAETRQVEVSKISRALKLLAKELKVPVIALSQLNRGPESRTDKKPMVSDLRESGAVEQDADVVILLHREDAYEKDSPRAGEVDLIVAKHRNGPTATISCAAQLHYSRFVDMTKDS